MAVFKGEETPYAQAQRSMPELVLSDKKINTDIEHYIRTCARQGAMLDAIRCIAWSEEIYDSSRTKIIRELTKKV